MTFIGIDPGCKGGIAIIDGDNIMVFPYSDEKYREIFEMYQGTNCLCFIEKVHSMPKQGVSSTFTFGMNYGKILGMLIGFRIPFELITPQKWKKKFTLIGVDKNASIQKCKELYPNVSLLATERSRKENDGMAEALLIATAAKRYYMGAIV